MENKEINTSKYSPASTAQVRMQSITDVVRAKRDILLKSPDRVNLNCLEDVQRASEEYLEHCVSHAVLPSFQGLSAYLGISRVFLYRYLDKHRETKVGHYLERLRSLFTDCRISAADKGACPESLTIFLLKNGNEGYADRAEYVLTPEKPDPFGDMDAEEARRRLIMAIPEEDDE